LEARALIRKGKKKKDKEEEKTKATTKETAKKTSRARRPRRRSSKSSQKANKQAPAAVAGLTTDEEGTPLLEEESYERPKGPVKSADPVVIEIPKAKPSNEAKEKKKPAKAKPKKKEPEKAKPQETTAVEEPPAKALGVPLSEVPRDFPVNIDQRVGVFVDVQNMFYTAKYKFNRKIDYKNLIESIARGRRVVRAMAYIVQAPEIDQSQFKHILEELGFELRIKELRVRADGTAKGDWDMGIAIDTITMREKLDVVALVSGDGDFTDLVYLLRSSGIRVEVYSFPSNTADDLIEAATYYHPMDEKFLMKW
jgi:uncharacterized LabA/DUF88 family protein